MVIVLFYEPVENVHRLEDRQSLTERTVVIIDQDWHYIGHHQVLMHSLKALALGLFPG